MRNICLSRSKFDFQCSLQKFEFDENGSHCRRSRICVRFTTRQKRHLSDRRTVWSCHRYFGQPLSQKLREERRRLESDPYRKSISYERIKLQWTKPLARLGEISFENFDLVSDLWITPRKKQTELRTLHSSRTYVPTTNAFCNFACYCCNSNHALIHSEINARCVETYPILSRLFCSEDLLSRVAISFDALGMIFFVLH